MKAKKFPPGGRTPDGAYQALEGIESLANAYCTTSGANLQEKVLSLLRVGESGALTLRDLTSATGANGRAIREAIRRMRLDGVPIVSGDNGYWISGSPGETRRFTRSMRSRAREIMRTARAVESGVAT